MNELLAIALDAHGGLDRWNKLKGLIAGMSISGSTWVIKGQPYLFNNVRIEMPIREQHMVTHLVGQGRKLIFEPDRVAVERSEEHTSELQSRFDLVCRLLLEKKKKKNISRMWLINAHALGLS